MLFYSPLPAFLLSIFFCSSNSITLLCDLEQTPSFCRTWIFSICKRKTDGLGDPLEPFQA